jgi:hypothetical protein
MLRWPVQSLYEGCSLHGLSSDVPRSWGFGLGKRSAPLCASFTNVPLSCRYRHPCSADRASSIQSSASRSHAALSTSSVAVLALARHSSAFRRYRSAFSVVMPYHARRADPFQASEIVGGRSRVCRLQRRRNSCATSSETSSDQRSAVLKATTRIGLLYWPVSRS